MGLFKRINDNIRANLNAILDKTEDPAKMLDQYLRDMEDDIADAETAVARQLAMVKRFKSRNKDASAMVSAREAQAVEALEKQREDLARRALEDKKLHMAKADEYQAQYEKEGAAADRLRVQLSEMKAEYEKLRARRDTLVARAQTANAQKVIYGIMGGIDRDDKRRGFERMEEKVLQMEAEAQVAVELRGSCQDLEKELAALVEDDVERELEQLKKKLNKPER